MKTMLAFLVLTATLGGCARYAVTEPESGKTYYTRFINRKLNGTVVFRDFDTGAKVRLSDSEIQRLTRDEFDARTTGSVEVTRR